MGDGTQSREAYLGIRHKATRGGTASATVHAEEQARSGKGLDVSVDPKGYPHLGPVRLSLPRFEKDGDVWVLVMGPPMAVETLLDTTGSMGDNVDKAFDVLLDDYDMLTSGSKPVLGRYDVQIATAIFNDVQDDDHVPVLARSQFEMAEKIAKQMTRLVPGRQGCGNGKEDPQFGLFGAAYLTKASICRYGLRSYHFAISDEPIVEVIDPTWLKRLFGDDVFERVLETGQTFTARDIPDTAQVVTDLQKIAHAFFLMVGERPEVKRQWRDLYGPKHFIMLPEGTKYLHYVKAIIIGLTEGVLDLQSAEEFLREHQAPAQIARRIVAAVAHIPLAAQATAPNFNKLPKIGDRFCNKANLWPIPPEELEAMEAGQKEGSGKKGKKDKGKEGEPKHDEWL